MGEIPWDVWLKYRTELKEAKSDEERKKIDDYYWNEYCPGEPPFDPDDDTVMLAGVSSE